MRQGNGKCDICGKVRGIAWSEFLKGSICLECAIEQIEALKPFWIFPGGNKPEASNV